MSNPPSKEQLAEVLLAIKTRPCDVCGIKPSNGAVFTADVVPDPNGLPKVVKVMCLKCAGAEHANKVMEN